MKKFIVALLLIVPLVSGCSTISTNLTINKDKSVSVKSSLNFDGDLANMEDLEAQTILRNYKSFIDDSYKVKIKNGDTVSTLTAEKSVKNIFRKDIDLSSLGFESNLSNKKYISVRHNFFVSSYNIDMIYNLQESVNEVELVRSFEESKKLSKSLNPEYLQKYVDKSDLITNERIGADDFRANLDESTYTLAKLDMKDAKRHPQKKVDYNINKLNTVFSISLPSPASFNNADTRSGNTYIWNLRKDAPTVIRLQYVVYSGFATTLLILAGISFLIYFARRILRHDSLKGVNRSADIAKKS